VSALNAERVLSVRHRTDTKFSFTTTRDPGFRFQNGQFTMLGLEVEGRPFRNHGRITDLITSNKLFDDLGLPPLDIETDRVMLCGSPGMLAELREMFEARDFVEGNHSEPGHFVIEKAFVER
jgi:ferredoxin-NADP reductase